MPNKPLVIFSIVVLGAVIFICAISGVTAMKQAVVAANQPYSAPFELVPDQSVGQADTQTDLTPEQAQKIVQAISWVLGIIVLVIIFRSGHGKAFGIISLALLLIVGAFWLLVFRGGDVSTSEARSASLQSIEPIQPVGDDPDSDLTRAEANNLNGKANIKFAFGRFIDFTGLYIGAIVATSIFLLVKWKKG